MAFAAIYIPEFPVASLLRRDASSMLHAAAVLEGPHPLERVFSMNQAARKLGLAHGMSKVQAETIGPVTFHKRSLAEEAAAFSIVQKTAECFSPRVQPFAFPGNAYQSAARPAASLLLDAEGTQKLFGSPQQYAEKLVLDLQAVGFCCSVAVTPNAEASLLLARSFTGVTCIGAGEIAGWLAALPVTSLPCDAATLALFRKWGVHTLSQLAALPEPALISRIGQQGRRLQRLARGVEDHLLVAEEPEFQLRAHVDLDTPVDLLESLLFVVSPMLEQLVWQAMNRAYSLRLVVLEMHLEKASPHTVKVHPALPSANRDLLLKLLHLELEADPPQAPVVTLTLTAEPARPQVAQRGLFQSQFPEPDKLDLLLARLRSIAGDDCVGSPLLRNTHCDDEFLITQYRPAPSPARVPLSSSPARVALRRMRPPHPIKVLLRNGCPACLYWQGDRLKLADATGPWHSSGYWWEERQWAAEEWDAVVAAPPHMLRLHHETRQGAWSISGIYD